MTVQEVMAIVLKADPTAQHYVSTSTSENYTVWQQTRRLPYSADDSHVAGWAFTIQRFTKTEFDPVADTIDSTLQAEYVSFRHTVDFNLDSMTIIHTWQCEVQ